jgi:hypothetical protein
MTTRHKQDGRTEAQPSSRVASYPCSGPLGKQSLVESDALALDTEVSFTENGHQNLDPLRSRTDPWEGFDPAEMLATRTEIGGRSRAMCSATARGLNAGRESPSHRGPCTLLAGDYCHMSPAPAVQARVRFGKTKLPSKIRCRSLPID